MKNLYIDTRILDDLNRKNHFLSEEIMMENAAAALEKHIENYFKNSKLTKTFCAIILCGGGNNGADGYALSRRLSGKYKIFTVQVKPTSSELAEIQKKRFLSTSEQLFILDDFIAQKEEFTNSVNSLLKETNAVIVDCVFGSGFHGEFSNDFSEFFKYINSLECFKIACDIPSGLSLKGETCENSFKADITVSMGALKFAFYTDSAKDITGTIFTENLGISQKKFEENQVSYIKLLEKTDLTLPVRNKNNVHKGTFGHAAVILGEKVGAASLAGTSALSFGCGLVTLVESESNKNSASKFKIPLSLMLSREIPENVSCLVLGPGFGRNGNPQKYIDFLKSHPKVKAVLDADIFYYPQITELLKIRPNGIILTPHPKEFSSLLKIAKISKTSSENDKSNFSVEDCVKFKTELMEIFCRCFPDVILHVKGANSITGTFCKNENGIWNFNLFVNPEGKPSLSKAGSGDVLSGFTAALLCQGYDNLSSMLNATLCHALCSSKIKNNFALTPERLITLVENFSFK